MMLISPLRGFIFLYVSLTEAVVLDLESSDLWCLVTHITVSKKDAIIKRPKVAVSRNQGQSPGTRTTDQDATAPKRLYLVIRDEAPIGTTKKGV
jgi:hypothetical protein